MSSLRKRKNYFNTNFSFAWLGLVVILVAIVFWRGTVQYNRPQIEVLPHAPSATSMGFIAASDKAFIYRVLILWLQQFDVQAGQYISYRQLDYKKLTDWLDVINQLEPSSQYSMLLSTRIYTKVADNERIRMMLDYVYKQFLKNPNKNWRWLAEATITAQHKLKDQPLALKYATALAQQSSEEIPYWAKDLRLIILENMGEIEQLKILVGGLIANKTVTDANEIRFLGVLMRRINEKSP